MLLNSSVFYQKNQEISSKVSTFDETRKYFTFNNYFLATNQYFFVQIGTPKSIFLYGCKKRVVSFDNRTEGM
jgi:hypothetical protein